MLQAGDVSMRINLFKRRRGSLGMEAVAIVPFAVIMILMSRFILEAMLTRQEVAVYTRGSTVSAAHSDKPADMSCEFDETPFSSRTNVSQTASVDCAERDGERGLQSAPEFFEAMRNGARPWPGILRDVDRKEPIMDMKGDGDGSMTFDRPDFLSTRGGQGSTNSFMSPQDELFDHSDDPYTAAHDPVVWAELNKSQTYKLFPDVFPSRNK